MGSCFLGPRNRDIVPASRNPVTTERDRCGCHSLGSPSLIVRDAELVSWSAQRQMPLETKHLKAGPSSAK